MSAAGTFRVHPKLMGVSQPKSSRLFWRCAAHNSRYPPPLQPPRRLLWNNSQCPSVVKLGAWSSYGELSGKFSIVRGFGFCHGLSRLSRCATHKWRPDAAAFPLQPERLGFCGRFELKTSVIPSFDRAGCISLQTELTVEPRLTGADQGPNCSPNVVPQLSSTAHAAIPSIFLIGSSPPRAG